MPEKYLNEWNQHFSQDLFKLAWRMLRINANNDAAGRLEQRSRGKNDENSTGKSND